MAAPGAESAHVLHDVTHDPHLLLQVDLLGKLLSEFPGASLAGIVVGNDAISRRDTTQEQLIETMAQVGRGAQEYRV